METTMLNNLLKEADGYCAFEVTLKVQYFVPKEYTGLSPEQLAKEWFEEFSLHQSHAFRNSCKIGNSEKVINVEILKNNGNKRTE